MNSPNPSSADPGADDSDDPAPTWTGARYVAMGSSFAAGPGIPHRVEGSPRPAGRSTGNYAHLVARRLGLDLVDVTFSGATTKEFVTGSASRPAQLDAVTEGTRLVTLTGGGNDVGFAPRILLSSLPFRLRELPVVRRQLASFADPQLTEERFTQLRENLLQLAARVRQRAPRSLLLFVEYLSVLPPDATWPTGLLPADVAEWGRGIARRLSETTQQAAAEAGAIFVPAGAMSASHHAWSSDPWTRRFHLSLHNGAPYHPTAKGMAAVADLVVESLPPSPG
ncbi:MAG TPA: SGNH/GDSL hydrolase family protein [Streptosporangiaceae bacterium]|nr:SGNH/GDSL hydrolase family protein [Streptosporangiaceae bacterium]